MKVLKFGGGCLKDAESIKKLPQILENYNDEHILIVVSAFGKLTNILENTNVCNKNYQNAEDFIKKIMLGLDFKQEKIDSVWNENITRYWSGYDINAINMYPYRVCLGEYISSEIISLYLTRLGLNNTLEDAACRVKTTSWDPIEKMAKFHSVQLHNDEKIPFPELKDEVFSQRYWCSERFKITQGFIASDINIYDVDSPKNIPHGHELRKTTLGREGSDYSAAIFGAAWCASQVVLFKDVDGVYTEDPKNNKDAKLFSQLNYADAFKLCNAGNTVVHPKTINHLQKAKIPIRIKSFFDIQKSGTLISDCPSKLQ